MTLHLGNRGHRAFFGALPGELGMISFRARSLEPPASFHGFVPPEATGASPPAVGEVLYHDFEPEHREDIPHVRLDPGGSREWSFCLLPAITWPWESPLQTVALSFEFQLVFKLPGADALLGPVRLPVVGEIELRE